MAAPRINQEAEGKLWVKVEAQALQVWQQGEPTRQNLLDCIEDALHNELSETDREYVLDNAKGPLATVVADKLESRHGRTGI